MGVGGSPLPPLSLAQSGILSSANLNLGLQVKTPEEVWVSSLRLGSVCVCWLFPAIMGPFPKMVPGHRPGSSSRLLPQED